MEMRESSFLSGVQVARELDANAGQVLEMLLQSVFQDQELQEEEERQVTKEYTVGALDPGKYTTKYEREIAFKKRKEATLN